MINKMISCVLPYMPKKLIWIFSKKYIAGEYIEDAIRVSKELNSQGMVVTIDLLGEFITKIEAAEENTKQYLEIIDRIQKENIEGNYSLKPTMFGLLIDKDKCYELIRKVVEKATQYGNFVRVDMEDSQCVDLELELFRKLRAEFPNNVGLVFQAYLKRTLDDIKGLESDKPENYRNNYRLCKGIYVEHESIAYKSYEKINNHYVEDIEYLLKNDIYVGIATHDKYLIEKSYELIKNNNISKDKYEFQMLLGVTPNLRDSVVKNGHKMRIYVPFGKQWFKYSTRRLKENPKMASHIIKAIFCKG